MPSATATEETVMRAYLAHRALLRGIAAGRFGVPGEDAEALVHDAFLAYLRNVSTVVDERRWLIGTVYNLCAAYWREHPPAEPLNAAEKGSVKDITAQMDARAVLASLSARCRQLLRWRYYDDLSASEIASRLDTTVDYARKLVYQCMIRARQEAGRR